MSKELLIWYLSLAVSKVIDQKPKSRKEFFCHVHKSVWLLSFMFLNHSYLRKYYKMVSVFIQLFNERGSKKLSAMLSLLLVLVGFLSKNVILALQNNVHTEALI